MAGVEHRHVGCPTTVFEASLGSIFSIRMVIMTEVGALTTRCDASGAISLVMSDDFASVMVWYGGWAIAGSIRCCLLKRCPM